MANRVDPDQLASLEANWSGTTLFEQGISGFSRTRVKNSDMAVDVILPSCIYPIKSKKY